MLQGELQRHADETAALLPQPRSQDGVARPPRGLRDAPVDHVPARYLPCKFRMSTGTRLVLVAGLLPRTLQDAPGDPILYLWHASKLQGASRNTRAWTYAARFPILTPKYIDQAAYKIVHPPRDPTAHSRSHETRFLFASLKWKGC